MKQTTFLLSRMSCASIAATLKGVLMSKAGVLAVDIDYDAEEIRVTFDETKTDPNTLIAAVGAERGIAMREKSENDTSTPANPHTC